VFCYSLQVPFVTHEPCFSTSLNLQRLLGMRGPAPDGTSTAAAAAAEATDQARPDQARPINPQQFQQKAGFWLTPGAVPDGMPAALAAALGSSSSSSSSADTDDAAACVLAGAQVAYLFAPLQLQQGQQQQQQQQQQGLGISWHAVQTMAEGLKPAAALFTANLNNNSSSSLPAASGGTAAPFAAAPGHLTASQVLLVEQQLQDRVLLAGHSSMVYRCTGIDSSVTPSTPGKFTWPAAAVPSAAAAASNGYTAATAGAAGEPGSQHHSANSHAEYFEKRYGVTGLRGDLPMLQVAGQGWRKGLGLLAYPLKPPQLQKVGGRAALATPEDLTAPEAAYAAVQFGGMQQQQQKQQHSLDMHQAGPVEQQQQQQQQVQPGSKHRFQLVSGGIVTAADNGNTSPVKTAAAAVAMEIDVHGSGRLSEQQQQQQQAYLPLELCWLLPLTAAQWSQLQLLPVFMHRINSLIRASRMQQHLAQLAATSSAVATPENPGHNSSSSSSVAKGSFPVPPLPLLVVCLTGAAAREAYDLEGLEFLGDVVLKFLATSYILQVGTSV
jgi:hypothetical protein